MQWNDVLSRERAAGYELDALGSGSVLVVGGGATGSNVVQTIALSGVADIVLVDDDVVEPSNLSRSPLVRKDRTRGSKARFKAREMLLGVRELGVNTQPRLRYAIARVQELGLGLIRHAKVVVACVDNIEARAWLAGATRLVGVPMVEIGLWGTKGHVSVFPNRSGDPCWRCLHPDASEGGVSCRVLAQGLVNQGMAPATQSVASVLGSLGAEATIQALHGRFPLSNQMLQIDVRTGTSRLFEIPVEPTCPGQHDVLDTIAQVDVTPDAPLEELFASLPADWAEPVVVLPSPFVLSFPCRSCGRSVRVRKPESARWSVPECATCGDQPPDQAREPEIVAQVRRGEQLGRTSCRRLGLRATAIVRTFDAATGAEHALQLAGSIDDLLTELRPPSSNEGAGPTRHEVEDGKDDPPALEQQQE
jgi:molybdopterin-synthase adenylyltransferase